jgi:hypothetical protein
LFQLYGLELLSSANSSLTSMEKKKILDHLNVTYNDIKSQANVRRFATSVAGLPDDLFANQTSQFG